MSTILQGIINYDYLIERMSELGVSEKDRTFERIWFQNASRKDDDGKIVNADVEHRREYKIFDADEEGNIIIRYFNLNGQPYRWHKEGIKQAKDYIRKRLRVAKDYKYFQEAGSPQNPFFNPGIIKRYQIAKEAAKQALISVPAEGQDDGSIATLFVVEGEFKSFKAYLTGIDIIGIPSIHGFYNGDVKGKLHEDIQDLIITCKVQKIVFLVDADLLTLKWAENKDLSTRANNFYSSIKAFRESVQLLIDDDKVALSYVYFMHLKTKYTNDAKGLDDLYCKYTSMVMEINEDLFQFAFAKKYFDGFQINDLNKDVNGRIFKYLGLTDEQEFYKTYQEFIGPREFKFKRRRYLYDNEKKEVVFVRHEDADKYMRIGPDWVKQITKLNKYGEKENELVSWKKSEITSDYKKWPDFLEQIMRYDDFCNEPNWNGNYQRVIQGCYNLVEPLSWKPAPGPITNTIKFLKHIFRGKGNIQLDSEGNFENEESIIGDQFTVAMDYLTILFRHPKHMLPVPILVSPENGTGKSTVLKWLQLIFGSSNMAILNNEQFKMKFNGHYITKFIIAIDEGFLEVDKKSEKERLKQLVTADSAYLENKGMNVRKMNYYGKLWISSNDADRVMKIDDGESRWFVVRVPVIPVEERDPDLELKLKSEIEAFLHFLYNRPIAHPRSDRLWFKPEWFITDQFKVIVETTKNRIDRVFENWIREQFLQFNLPVLRYTTSNLLAVINDPKTSKYRIDELELKNYLTSKGLVPEPKSIYHKSPKWFADKIEEKTMEASKLEDSDLFKGTPTVVWWSGTGRPYTFKAEDWLSVEELSQISAEPKIESKDDLPF